MSLSAEQQTLAFNGLAEAVRSLNDIVSEIVCGLADEQTPTKGYAYTVVKTLAEHTRKLGGEPSLDETVLDGWEDEQ